MSFSLSKISLRIRLFALTALALAALLIAMLSAYRTAQMSAAFSERRAEINVQAAARELARESENIGNPPNAGRKRNFPPHAHEVSRRYADDYSRSAAFALERFPEVSGGFCAEDGRIVGFAGGDAAFSDLAPPEICRAFAKAEDFQSITLKLSGENFYAAFAPVAENERTADLRGVFTFQKLPENNIFSDRFNLITQFFLLVCAVALAVFAFTTFRRWQSGMSKIEGGLREISGDLSRRIEPPQIAELARISREINRLAENLETNLLKQKELEKDLAGSEKLAALGRVASGVAHEIRNPLAAMKLKIQLAARSSDFDKAKLGKTFSVLNEEITRLDNLISKMLNAGKPEKLNFEMLAPTGILRGRLEILREKAGAQNVEIETDFADAGEKLAADGEKLAQVFENLLLNALEAMPDGGVLRVRSVIDADKIIYEFSDSGAGVPAAEKERIFEPFFTTKDTGTGLGLAISREIIEAHGGRLFLAEPEKGARFVVELKRNL